MILPFHLSDPIFLTFLPQKPPASFRYSTTHHFFTLFYGQSLDAMLFSQPKVNSTNLHDGMENGKIQKGDRIMARIGEIARPPAVRIQSSLIKLN